MHSLPLLRLHGDVIFFLFSAEIKLLSTVGVTHGAVDDSFVVAVDGAAAAAVGGAVVEHDDSVAVAAAVAAAVDGATAAAGESVEVSSCQTLHLKDQHLQDHSVALTQHGLAVAVTAASVAAVAAVPDDHSTAEENGDAAVVDAVAGPAQETGPEMKGEETGVGIPKPCWPPPPQPPPAVGAVTATCHSAPDTSKDFPSKDQVSSEYTCTHAESGPSPSASSRAAPSRPHPHPANSLSATTTFAEFERVFLSWIHHQPCLTVPLQLQQSQKPSWLAQSKTVPWPMQGQG